MTGCVVPVVTLRNFERSIPPLLDSLIPVLGTLAGALIGGGVSVLTQRFTARYTREIQLKNMAEERARWAAETKLRELKKLYGQVADFLDATGELRRTQARKLYLSEDTEVSKTTLNNEYDAARGQWEPALTSLLDDTLLFDIDIHDMFVIAMKLRQDWFLAKTSEEGLKHLLALEENLKEFSRKIAERYRDVFSDRQGGKDNPTTGPRAG
jgi:hypothetical protein